MASWKTPSDLKYLKSDEWVRIEGDTATLGISDYAQDQINDITFVELPAVGTSLKKGDQVASIELVKAASEIYMPISGMVTEVNKELESAPETINVDPYSRGWLIKVKVTGDTDNPDLLSAEQYAEWCNTR